MDILQRVTGGETQGGRGWQPPEVSMKPPGLEEPSAEPGGQRGFDIM